MGLDPAAIDNLTVGDLRGALAARRAYDEYYHRRPVLVAGRLSGYLALQPYTPKSSNKGPKEIHPFDWERQAEQATKPAKKKLSVAEAEAAFARFKT